MKLDIYTDMRGENRMFSPSGHGMSCFHCDDCNCSFGIDCLDVPAIVSCPTCGSEEITWTMERLVGSTVREYESVEGYEESVGKRR